MGMNLGMRHVIAGASLALLVACGASDEPSSAEPEPAGTEEAAPPAALHNASDIRKHIGVGADGIYTTKSGIECEIAEVMTDAATVDMYASAGDNVAANPDATAGVKIIAEEAATCQTALTKALADF